MRHQQLARTAPALWVDKEPSSSVLTDCHRVALDHLGRAFTEARPLAILIGDGKSGASYVIGRFLAGIEGDVAVVRISEPCADAIAGMREVIHAVGFEPKDLSLTDLENVFTMFLSFQKTHHRRTIICMEETQDNGWCMLDGVRRLVELETEGKFGMMVILSGRPTLNKLLNRPPLDAICAQAEQRIALTPFTLAETREYIRRRVESAGTANIAQVFEFDAITLVHELCAGVPDAISNLYCKCLQLVDEKDMTPVTTDLVKKAGQPLRLASMIQQSDTEAGSVEFKGVSPQRGRLIARMNGELVQELPLKRGHILIGRDELCEIRIVSPPVSRHHALIVNSSNGVKLVDLGSTNGTLVDGHKIKQHTLQDNNVITVGDCMIEYVAGDDHKSWFLDTDPTEYVEMQIADPAPPGRSLGREMGEEPGRTGGYNDSRFREKVEVIGNSLDVLRDSIATICVDRPAATWDERYNELFAFKEEFNHCNVRKGCKKFPYLYDWCTDQRELHKRRQQGDQKCNLPDDQIQRLEEVGFKWNLFDARWDEMFARLLAYKEEHHDCNVPKAYDKDSQLGSWCSSQRTLYKKEKLRKERIKRLESIDFEWVFRRSQTKSRSFL